MLFHERFNTLRSIFTTHLGRAFAERGKDQVCFRIDLSHKDSRRYVSHIQKVDGTLFHVASSEEAAKIVGCWCAGRPVMRLVWPCGRHIVPKRVALCKARAETLASANWS